MWTSKLILSTDSLGAPKVQRRSRYQLSGNIRDFAVGNARRGDSALGIGAEHSLVATTMALLKPRKEKS